MDKSLVAGLIIAGIFIFVLGGGFGVLYKTQQSYLMQQKAIAELSAKLNSKVLFPISASGKVSAISGKNITLTQNGDSLAITMSDNAKVEALSYSGTLPKVTMKRDKASVGNIKVGDNVNVTLKILEDGTLSAQSATIMPAPLTIPTPPVKTK